MPKAKNQLSPSPKKGNVSLPGEPANTSSTSHLREPTGSIPLPHREGLGEGSLKLVPLAKQLRKKLTKQERLLWSKLRAQQLGIKFRRQHSIGSYILDFYSPQAKLAIELDGGQHNTPQTKVKDEQRTAYLNSQGIRVLRFWNNQITEALQSVLEVITKELNKPSLSPSLEGREIDTNKKPSTPQLQANPTNKAQSSAQQKPPKLSLSSPLSSLKGVGEAKYKQLQEVGLATISDLLDYWPRRYVDYSKLSLIKDLTPGLITIKVKFSNIRARHARGRFMHLTEAIAEDEKGGKIPIIWFNQPYRATSLKKETWYYISGQFKPTGSHLNLTNPTTEEVKELEQTSTARIIPIYPEKLNLNSRLIRSLILQIKDLAKQIPETLPSPILQEYKLISKAEAIWQLHVPESMASLSLAKKRLAFEEILTLQLAVQKNKQFIKDLTSPAIKFNLEDTKKLISGLKFKLTDQQRSAAWQILQDLQKTEPMNRMLMGDVGSGKTVVAALAALQAIRAGKQVAILAPTEVLARQHYKSLTKLLLPADITSLQTIPPLGEVDPERNPNGSVELLVSSIKLKQKSEILSKIEDGSAKLIIGTHALLQEKVKFQNLSLVIVDEQHRFGVGQRKDLQKRVKTGTFPHLLTMTATPIPRSLALILYGELDQSLIKSKPPGRIEIQTELIPGASKQKVWDKMKEELSLDHAVIIVCPNITDTENSARVSAEKVYDEISKKAWVKKHGIGLLHGKLKAEQKEQVMADFASGKINTLVSTTVIEVGIDVPRATLIVIEGAEYFGLAQLHQLRGRVGRSNLPSFCYLVPANNQNIPKRLRYFAENSDGFKLAQYDLEQRGPGQIYGKLQSGSLDLRLIDLHDLSLIESAKIAAESILKQKLTLSTELKANISKHQDLEYLN